MTELYDVYKSQSVSQSTYLLRMGPKQVAILDRREPKLVPLPVECEFRNTSDSYTALFDGRNHVILHDIISQQDGVVFCVCGSGKPRRVVRTEFYT